jgi:hypothetical protein
MDKNDIIVYYYKDDKPIHSYPILKNKLHNLKYKKILFIKSFMYLVYILEYLNIELFIYLVYFLD